MKRNKILRLSRKNNYAIHKKRIAFHEAGHAVGVQVNNALKKLPPVFFKITFNDNLYKSKHSTDSSSCLSKNEDHSANVEGGRLINNLPDSLDNYIKTLDKESHTQDSKDFIASFEADMVNLLIGPLAEAKHVALSDDELFHKNLFIVDTLHNYGGTSDIALINEYLDCFSSSPKKQNQKLAELLEQAFYFVDDESNWEKITKLANYIIDNDIKTIDYNKISTVLNN